MSGRIALLAFGVGVLAGLVGFLPVWALSSGDGAPNMLTALREGRIK